MCINYHVTRKNYILLIYEYVPEPEVFLGGICLCGFKKGVEVLILSIISCIANRGGYGNGVKVGSGGKGLILRGEDINL